MPDPPSAGGAPAAPSAPYAIVPAAPGDLPAIRRLLRQAGFARWGLQPSSFLVARQADGTILACGRIQAIGGQRVLGSVVVDRPWRQRGIGRAVIAALLAREPGPLLLMCTGPLRPYYAAFGFAPVPPRTAPFGLRWRYAVWSALDLVRTGRPSMTIMRRVPGPPQAPGAGAASGDDATGPATRRRRAPHQV